MLSQEMIEKLKKADVPLGKKVEAVFQGTCALQNVAEKSIVPRIVEMINRSDLETALAATYYRMYAWMVSLTQLRSPIHLQAVCSATRSMFELLIDLKSLLSG